MKEKTTASLIYDTALVTTYIAVAAYISGIAYYQGFLSSFGLTVNLIQQELYTVMAVTWMTVLCWLLSLLAVLFLKSLIGDHLRETGAKEDDSKGLELAYPKDLIDRFVLGASILALAIYSNHDGKINARHKITHPSPVEIVSDKPLSLPKPLYFAEFGSERYLFFTTDSTNQKVLQTFIVPQSQIISLSVTPNATSTPK